MVWLVTQVLLNKTLAVPDMYNSRFLFLEERLPRVGMLNMQSTRPDHDSALVRHGKVRKEKEML